MKKDDSIEGSEQGTPIVATNHHLIVNDGACVKSDLRKLCEGVPRGLNGCLVKLLKRSASRRSEKSEKGEKVDDGIQGLHR